MPQSSGANLTLLAQKYIYDFCFSRPRPEISRASFWVAILRFLVQTVVGLNLDGNVYAQRNETLIICWPRHPTAIFCRNTLPAPLHENSRHQFFSIGVAHKQVYSSHLLRQLDCNVDGLSGSDLDLWYVQVFRPLKHKSIAVILIV